MDSEGRGKFVVDELKLRFLRNLAGGADQLSELSSEKGWMGRKSMGIV